MSSQDSNQAPGAEELRRLYRQAGFDEVPSSVVPEIFSDDFEGGTLGEWTLAAP